VLQVVWFKKDLRVNDHAPLSQAALKGPVLALYCHEPSLITAPDCAVQHTAFALECLVQLRTQLTRVSVPLWEVHSEVIPILADLLKQQGIFTLWSHEETGNGLSYSRDIAVGKWCSQNAIDWHESPNNAVVRRLNNRDRWSAHWDSRMSIPPLLTPVQLCGANIQSRYEPPALDISQDKPLRQRGGLSQAQLALDSFFGERGIDYRQAMSSPLTAQDACSRISPYLAFGVLSIKQVVHRLWSERQKLVAQLKTDKIAKQLASIKSFEGRLHWHCHFIQKLESEPQIEWRNIHRAYDNLRTEPVDHAKLVAWQQGATGFPMIDACMRMLAQTGWLNFRMRAMVVSFSSYQLWQDWRAPAQYLAREFLDYEPGIHYSQMQMQSGTTGINTIRMYNPVKQAQDQDPSGAFVRHWIPALRQVPDAFIFEPWLMPSMIQEQAHCLLGVDYPRPIVDLIESSKFAREAAWRIRDEASFSTQARAIYNKHGSRNPRREGTSKKRAGSQRKTSEPGLVQLGLFDSAD
jgi:deoxyribodipyrimidine photo-lyase